LVGRTERTAVLLDPHPLWLDALETILTSMDVTVLGRTTLPAEALTLVEAMRPDLLICETETVADAEVGSELIRACCERLETLRVIVIGASRDPVHINAAFDAGASAYAVKTAHPGDVAATVRQAFEQTIFFATMSGPGSNGEAVNGRSALAAGENGQLTTREREILTLAAEGHSNRDLARMLWVTEQTVKFHLSNIYRKLGVANRTEASAWAHRHGLVSS